MGIIRTNNSRELPEIRRAIFRFFMRCAEKIVALRKSFQLTHFAPTTISIRPHLEHHRMTGEVRPGVFDNEAISAQPKTTLKKVFLKYAALFRNRKNNLRVHRGVWTTRGQAVDKPWTRWGSAHLFAEKLCFSGSPNPWILRLRRSVAKPPETFEGRPAKQASPQIERPSRASTVEGRLGNRNSLFRVCIQ